MSKKQDNEFVINQVIQVIHLPSGITRYGSSVSDLKREILSEPLVAAPKVLEDLIDELKEKAERDQKKDAFEALDELYTRYFHQ